MLQESRKFRLHDAKMMPKGTCFLLIFCSTVVNQRNITSDMNDLYTTIQDIRSACQKMPATAEDRFAVVMSVSFQSL